MINKGDLIADRYLILDTLGEGGMSNVYLAEDTFLHRRVALKSLRLDLTDNQQFRQRFQRESRAMSELSSPYIVNILDIGDESFPYIVMEYVKGPSLKKYLRQNFPISHPQILRFMAEILQGVTVAHQHGIIHRDLKPQNVFITSQGHAKVGDFGIALSLGEQSITQSDATIGSVHYMAPERVRGAQATVQSDIYSLGIILFEMLTGRLPFDAETSMAVAAKHFNEPMPNLCQIDTSIPQPLANVVLKATAKVPSQRYSTVSEMAQDLETSLDADRINEKPFIPAPINTEETKVLSNVHEQTTTPSVNPQSDLTTDHKKPVVKKKHHHRWLLVLLVILIIVIGFGFWYNRKEVPVPDVQDLSLNQARAVLSNSNLKVGAITKKTSNTIRAQNVISSIPPKGSHLKAGTKVKLIQSMGPVKKSLPNVQGWNYYAAKKRLHKAGFKVQRKNRYSKTVPAGKVIRQTPQATKRKTAQNRVIHLTISLGIKNTGVTVKDLTGYNLRGAQDYANESGLHLVVKTVASETVDKGLVISQSPVAGTRVMRGSDLVISVSSGGNNVVNNPPQARSAANDDAAPTDDVQNVSRTVTVPFNSQTNNGTNVVKIHVQDLNHNLNDVYQTLNITADTPVTINLQLNKGQSGQYSIERDGQTIDSQTVTGN